MASRRRQTQESECRTAGERYCRRTSGSFGRGESLRGRAFGFAFHWRGICTTNGTEGKTVNSNGRSCLGSRSACCVVAAPRTTMTPPTQIFLPTHGGQLRQIAARYGFEPEQLIDFSANINPAGAPASVLIALQQALANPAVLVAYPDLELTELKKALAEASETLPENIAVANGFVPLLEAALRSLKIARCLLPVPSFSEYRQTLTNAGVEVAHYYLAQDEGFSCQPETLLRAALKGDCDA